MRYYSYTSLSTYETCPLMYRYSYIDRIEAEETIDSFMGKKVHETLFKLYHDMLLSKTNTLEELTDHYRKAWDNGRSDEIVIFNKALTEQDYINKGIRCISNYYERYRPFNDSKTIGIEQQIIMDIGGYALKGYIDRVSMTPEGVFRIHDYKTTSQSPDKSADRQLSLYQIGVGNRWKNASDIELIWHYLSLDTEVKSKKLPEDLTEVKESIIGTIGNIERSEKEQDFPPVRSNSCMWCAYRGICGLITV